MDAGVARTFCPRCGERWQLCPHPYAIPPGADDLRFCQACARAGATRSEGADPLPVLCAWCRPEPRVTIQERHEKHCTDGFCHLEYAEGLPTCRPVSI